MKDVFSLDLAPDQAAIWFIGQSGYIFRTAGTTVVIDPYLSDSVSRLVPDFIRLYPPPIPPEELEADVFIVTHDHLDHLDPDTIGPYRFKDRTTFVSPRLAARKLLSLGVPERNLLVVDSGMARIVQGMEIAGIYAVPNEPAVLDTAGYRLSFANGRSVYHSSDTGFSEVLLDAVPQAEVALVCINGKAGNLDVAQAARVAAKARPRIALPHHHDMFRLNSADPCSLGRHLQAIAPNIRTPVPSLMEPLVWPAISNSLTP